MSPVPQELVDMIIAHLWDDPAALYCCALVSTRFHSFARKLLYRKLLIAPPKEAYACNTKGWISSPHLLLVLSKHPEYAEYIQNIKILNAPRSHGERQSWLESDETLERVLPLLTNLTQFVMTGITPLCWTDWKVVSDGLKRAVKLLLNGGTRGDGSDLTMAGLRTVGLENIPLPRGLIRCLLNGGVEELWLRGIELVEDKEFGELCFPGEREPEEPDPGKGDSTLKRLKKLCLDLPCEHLEDFAHYLYSTKLRDKLSRVQHLHLTPRHYEIRGQEVFAKLIECCKDSLETLEFSPLKNGTSIISRLGTGAYDDTRPGQLHLSDEPIVFWSNI